MRSNWDKPTTVNECAQVLQFHHEWLTRIDDKIKPIQSIAETLDGLLKYLEVQPSSEVGEFSVLPTPLVLVNSGAAEVMEAVSTGVTGMESRRWDEDSKQVNPSVAFEDSVVVIQIQFGETERSKLNDYLLHNKFQGMDSGDFRLDESRSLFDRGKGAAILVNYYTELFFMFMIGIVLWCVCFAGFLFWFLVEKVGTENIREWNWEYRYGSDIGYRNSIDSLLTSGIVLSMVWVRFDRMLHHGPGKWKVRLQQLLRKKEEKYYYSVLTYSHRLFDTGKTVEEFFWCSSFTGNFSCGSVTTTLCSILVDDCSFFRGKYKAEFVYKFLDEEHLHAFSNVHNNLLSIGCSLYPVDYARSLFDRGKHTVITSKCFEKLSFGDGFQFVFGEVKMGEVVNSYTADACGWLFDDGVCRKILLDNTRSLFDRGKCATISFSTEELCLQLILDLWFQSELLSLDAVILLLAKWCDISNMFENLLQGDSIIWSLPNRDGCCQGLWNSTRPDRVRVLLLSVLAGVVNYCEKLFFLLIASVGYQLYFWYQHVMVLMIVHCLQGYLDYDTSRGRVLLLTELLILSMLLVWVLQGDYGEDREDVVPQHNTSSCWQMWGSMHQPTGSDGWIGSFSRIFVILWLTMEEFSKVQELLRTIAGGRRGGKDDCLWQLSEGEASYKMLCEGHLVIVVDSARRIYNEEDLECWKIHFWIALTGGNAQQGSFLRMVWLTRTLFDRGRGGELSEEVTSDARKLLVKVLQHSLKIWTESFLLKTVETCLNTACEVFPVRVRELEKGFVTAVLNFVGRVYDRGKSLEKKFQILSTGCFGNYQLVQLAISFSWQGATKGTAQPKGLLHIVVLTRRLFDRDKGFELTERILDKGVRAGGVLPGWTFAANSCDSVTYSQQLSLA